MRIAWTVLAVSLAATPVLAAEGACLQNNRLVSTRVIDSRTIAAIDRMGQRFTVHMRGNCIGLNRTSEYLSFRTKTQLGCLSRGDTISYNRPGEGTPVRARGSTQTPCFVDFVTQGAPPAGR
jgi:hypothetical protein